MNKDVRITSIAELLDVIEKNAINSDQVSLDAIMDAVGSRSFGPLLLVAGLVTLTPVIGDIPGVPVLMGLLVLLTAIQLLFRRKYFWLPGWLLKRSVKRKRLCKMLDWLRKPAGRVDRLLQHRLAFFTHGAGVYLIALASIAVALVMPAMELVPFSVILAGLVLSSFGLALIAHDGLPALLGLILTGGIFAGAGYMVL